MLRPRRAFLWLGAIWAIAYLTGGLSLWAIPCLALAWLVLAAFYAGLGLWLSIRSRTTLHATTITVLGIVVVMLASYTAALLLTSQPRCASLEALMLPYGAEVYERGMHPDKVILGLVLLPVYAVGACCLWLSASRRFRRLSNRMAVQRPNVPRRQRLPEIKPMDTLTAMNPAASQQAPAARPYRRRRWRRIVVCSVCMAALIGAWFTWDAAADRRAGGSRCRARPPGPGWRWADLRAARAVISDDEKSAPLVVAAAQLLPPQSPLDNSLVSPTPNRRLKDSVDYLHRHVEARRQYWRVPGRPDGPAHGRYAAGTLGAM